MMKRLLAVLLIALTLPIGIAGAEYMSIVEMRETVPQRWTQTYETKWRTIEIDVQPSVPQTDKLPVLKVAHASWQPDVSSLGMEWKSLIDGERVSFSVNYNDVDKIDRASASTKIYAPPYDSDRIYGENSNLTFGEAISCLRDALELLGNTPDEWDFECPTELLVNSSYRKETGETPFPNIYTIAINQKLYGVPMLGHVLDGVENRNEWELWSYMGWLRFSICTPDDFYLCGIKGKAIDTLAMDVPLCDYSIIQSALESEIQAGHIRKIFDIDLGYALYNEPNSSPDANHPKSAVFYAAPVWRINCYYVESAKKEIRDYTGKDVPERSVIEYKTLFVNAQTGIVVDRSDNHKGCGDYQGFISWEEVGGKNQ